ncbi:MAG TPA: hypothetical protein VMZ74_17500 [Ramlibacter sp.]|nr:hypothetical protein [Ramlibacter sp.]
MPTIPYDTRGGPARRLFPAALIASVVGLGLYFDHADSFEAPATEIAMKETTMNPRPPGKDSDEAQHGARSEVTWEGGSGRQPYSNQGNEEAAEPNGGDDVAEGNRGERSGRNLDQLEEARRKP